MMITTDAACLSHHYRLGLVRVSFCLWCKYTCDYPHIQLQNERHLHVNHRQSDIGIQVTQHLPDPYLEKLIQIPIARSSPLAIPTVPAVSSPEAYQTPAR
jgi:hypothetical protein